MTEINDTSSDLEAFRDRIYGAYVSARPTAAAGAAELAARRPYLARLVRRHFPRERDAAVIDLGCGSGTLIEIAKAAGYENIRGVDRSPEQVALAVARGLGNVKQADLLATLQSLAARSQDAVADFDVVEHSSQNLLAIGLR